MLRAAPATLVIRLEAFWPEPVIIYLYHYWSYHIYVWPAALTQLPGATSRGAWPKE